MLKPNQLKIYIGKDYEIDLAFEKKLAIIFNQHGYRSTGQGKDLETGIRDICFEKKESEDGQTHSLR